MERKLTYNQDPLNQDIIIIIIIIIMFIIIITLQK